jgi:zinc and cadmium transporter
MEFGFYLTVIFIVTLLGGVLPLLLQQSRKLLSPAVAFAAGLLIGSALLHLLPESMEIMGPQTGWPILLGFTVFYLPQKFVMAHTCEEEDCDFHKLGILAFIGIAFHAVVDGVGVGAAYSLPETVNIVVAAVSVHKIPAAVALSFLLLASGMERSRIAILVLMFALATPVGALVTKVFLIQSNLAFMGWALGLAAGNFLAIAGSDLFRRIHERDQYGRARRVAFISLGFAVSLLGGEIR